jgi:hypothetical protein
MQKAEIKPRTEYAFREKRAAGPIERVRVLEHIRGNKWKTEWLEPNPGLVHYVESGQLLCPWKERKAFMREEESRERLVKHNDEQGYSENSPIAHALYQVFESAGESELSFYKGVPELHHTGVDASFHLHARLQRYRIEVRPHLGTSCRIDAGEADFH